MDLVRLYGDKKDINQNSVKEFFNSRANKKVENLMTITSFQEKENLDKRQNEESEIILENLDVCGKKIIEIGCGLGRWAKFFHNKCESYLGIDNAENLITLANENYKYENCFFQEMSALNIDINKLKINPPFDIVFITGLLIYLNDEDIDSLINQINKLVSKEKQIYIRETVSVMGTRVTLKDFYSDDLQTEYNAIYRTSDELLEFFNGFDDANCVKFDEIHESLNKHDETGYKYFILK